MCIHSLFEGKPATDYDMIFNNKNYPEQPAKMLTEALSDIQRKLFDDREPTRMSFISITFIESQIEDEQIAAEKQNKVTTSGKGVKLSGKQNVVGNAPTPAVIYTRKKTRASTTVSAERKVCTVPGVRAINMPPSIDFPVIHVPEFKYGKQADGLYDLLTHQDSWTSFNA